MAISGNARVRSLVKIDMMPKRVGFSNLDEQMVEKDQFRVDLPDTSMSNDTEFKQVLTLNYEIFIV